MNMKKSKLLLSVVCGCSVLALSGCKKGPAGSSKNKKDVEAVFAVTAYKAVPSTLDDYLEFGGDVDAASSVAVMPDTAGKISQVNVKIGQHVERNQILAAVNTSRPGMVFADSPVRSPVAGTVTYFPGVIGTSVSQQSVIAKISSVNELEIQTAVPERFVSRVSLNQNANLSFNAYPGEVFSAHIKEISPVLDITSRTMNIKFAIDSPDPRIKIGMYAKIKLVTEHREDAIVVPYGTVVSRNGEDFVFVAKKDGDKMRASFTPVKVGIRVDNNQEIVQGVSKDDLVIVKGQTLLSDGALVNIVTVTNEEK